MPLTTYALPVRHNMLSWFTPDFIASQLLRPLYLVTASFLVSIAAFGTMSFAMMWKNKSYFGVPFKLLIAAISLVCWAWGLRSIYYLYTVYRGTAIILPSDDVYMTLLLLLVTFPILIFLFFAISFVYERVKNA
jgi:hypothetical protein